MMTNITKEFRYKTADDMYSQTTINNTEAVATYVGPERKYAIIDSTTNKLTGATITEEQFETYNESNVDSYAIEINCNDHDTVICAMLDGGINPIGLPTISEDIPGSDFPFIRTDPVLPIDTYELTEIQYDRANGNFVKPYPLKAATETWSQLINYRNVTLSAADRTLSEDLPEALYTKVAEYKQYLRDVPVTFGGSWAITIATAGTGYTIGDRILINDPIFKLGQPAADILITVSAVTDNGAITSITKSNAEAHSYHPTAATYNNVFAMYSGSGNGATFNLSKVATVPAFKIRIKDHPLV
jgi:hypothetical protein